MGNSIEIAIVQRHRWKFCLCDGNLSVYFMKLSGLFSHSLRLFESKNDALPKCQNVPFPFSLAVDINTKLIY